MLGRPLGRGRLRAYPPTLIDSVFLDAVHANDDPLDAHRRWRSKVKSGGILRGREYSSLYPGVVQAIRDFAGEPSGYCRIHVGLCRRSLTLLGSRNSCSGRYCWTAIGFDRLALCCREVCRSGRSPRGLAGHCEILGRRTARFRPTKSGYRLIERSV